MVRKEVGVIFLFVFSILLIISISNFASALCAGTINCNYIYSAYTCDNTYGAYCYYSGSMCVNKGPIPCYAIPTQNLCTSEVDCTWDSGEPAGCLYDSDCNYGETCEGENQYCTGTHLVEVSWFAPSSNPVSGVTRDAQTQALFDWSSSQEYYPKCYFTSGEGYWDCGTCNDCGDARANNVAYAIESGTQGYGWYRRDCVWTSVLGACFNPRWAAGRAYIGPAYVARGMPCSSFYQSTCASNYGCSWYVREGTCTNIPCAPSCSGKNCGSDGCGGSCGSYGNSRPGYHCTAGTWEPDITYYCGDGNVDSGEVCDGSNFNGKTCASQMGAGYTGTLTCNSCTSITTGNCIPPCTCSDDGNPCTTDACVSGSCQHTPLTGTACTSDGNECTNDVCSSSGTCSHNALTGNSCSSDGNSCTQDVCNSGGSCAHNALTGTACTSDNNACTNDVCNSGGSCAHNTIGSCINNDGCCPNGCNSGNDNDCIGCSSNGQCSDGNSCTSDVCSGGSCSNPPISGCCTASPQCNDNNACTTNLCVGTCSYITINNCCVDSSDCGGDDICVSNQCTAPTGWCGDGSVNQVNEDCDGSDLNGESCASVLGSGYTGNLGCSGCSFDTSGCYETVIPPTVDCPDDYCDSGAGENCGSCPQDCGACPPELYCGDGDCNNGEDCETCPGDCGICVYCGDGDCNNGETCADCDTDCGCASNEACQGGSCVLLCGNGFVNSGEDCDGGNLGGETCASVLGPEYTGDLGCSGCYFDTDGCYLACDLTSASWSATSALDEGQVKLNINGDNCDGITIAFTVMEKDGFLNADDPVEKNPSDIIYASPNRYGLWIVEWQDDAEFGQSNPPEYYFIATAQGAGDDSITSSIAETDMLKVFQEDVICSGVNFCSNYLTESECEVDLCSAGVDSSPSSVTCGGTFNPETGCYDYTSCGCTWDSSANTCEADWQSESGCGVCGNHIKDTGEECDDGNLLDLDGCSSTCTYESGLPSPCTEGLTLCSDGTCSLNCDATDEGVAACDYDNKCDVGEGCTCKDCNSEQDTCKNGLICNIIDSACCSSESNKECNPYCAYVDPDCSPAVCGNGFQEVGEECDLGERNNNSDSGCSSTCKYVVLEPPCSEGTNLCNDDTCSLNCDATDEGIQGCGEAGACKAGLTCSVEDKACCRWSKDGYCDSHCAFVDQDCQPKLLTEGIFSIGTCLYTENSKDTCEDDGMLIRSLSALWNWSIENTFGSNPDGLDYWQPSGSGIFRYDPLDYSGLRKSQNCVYIEDTFACPAAAQVSFFGTYQLIIAIVLVGIIYLIYALGKKKHSKITGKRRRK